MSDALLVGIDVGTSTCKAAVVDAAGAELAHGSAPTPWERVPSGAEVDPEALFAAAVQAAREALDAAPAGRVAGLGVTSMAETGVLLDEDGAPVAPAIAWHDARGAGEAQAIAAELGAFTERTGLPATPLCSLAKLRWLREHHAPSRAGRRWLNVGEWVVRRFGGEEVTERSLASRTGLLDLAALAPYADALEWAGLPADLLPELVLAGTPAGIVDGASLPGAEGAVLTVGGHDHLCAGVGVGVTAAGDVLDSCGTAEALVRVAPPLSPGDIRRCVESGITVGWHVGDGRQALLGSAWSGLALREVLDALGADRAEVDAEALAMPPGAADGLELDLELHSLDRPPLRLPDAPRGLVWRAAIDVCEAESAALLERMAAVAGPHRRVVVAGGWARDDAFMQAKAALGAVEAPPVTEAGARGAALLAGVAAGLYPSIDDLPAVAGGVVPVPTRRS